MEGPMGPMGLGSKTIKLWKSSNIMKIMFFDNMEKCAQQFCKGSTERQLQIIHMVILEANFDFDKVWKSSKIGQILGLSRGPDH